MKFEKGKIFNANELVDYADGGVVSKKLIHNTAGSVTLFSFDAGQGTQHTAPFDAFIQVIDGEIILNVVKWERKYPILYNIDKSG